MSSQISKSKNFIIVGGIVLLVAIVTYSAFSALSTPKKSGPKHRAHQAGKHKAERRAKSKKAEAIKKSSAAQTDTKTSAVKVTDKAKKPVGNTNSRKLSRQAKILNRRLKKFSNMSEGEYAKLRERRKKLPENRAEFIAKLKKRLDKLDKRIKALPKPAAKAPASK